MVLSNQLTTLWINQLGLHSNTSVWSFRTWPSFTYSLVLTMPAMEEQKVEVYEEDKLTQLQETFLGMLADAPTPARQQSAKKLKVEHPGRRTARPSSTTAPHDDSHQTTQVSQLCRMLAVLALRHEDALNSLACQDQFILFLAHGPQGMPE